LVFGVNQLVADRSAASDAKTCLRGSCSRFGNRAGADLAFAAACLYMVLAWGGGETGFEIVNMGREMTRAPVLAAGGIVMRSGETPLLAVVLLRKRNEWVLPKGKLDDGETPRGAAEREVVEETGHQVSVHEFLGTLVYESGGRSKVVHYWRMETSGEQVCELMDDVKAVEWLPLDAAVERLSRAYERVFLANVGPLALEAAAPARFARQLEASQLVQGSKMQFVEADAAAPAADPESRSNDRARAGRSRRRNLVQKMRDWLRRAA
jgi:8-oxo-dGTP diphosphatase